MATQRDRPRVSGHAGWLAGALVLVLGCPPSPPAWPVTCAGCFERAADGACVFLPGRPLTCRLDRADVDRLRLVTTTGTSTLAGVLEGEGRLFTWTPTTSDGDATLAAPHGALGRVDAAFRRASLPDRLLTELGRPSRGALDRGWLTSTASTADDPTTRLHARRLLARYDLARGRLAAAAAALESTAQRARELGLPVAQASDHFGRAYALLQLARYEDAERAIRRGAALEAPWPEARAKAAFYRAILAHRVGDLRRASREVRRARRDATALGLARLDRKALDVQIHVLLLLGRWGAIEPLLSELAEDRGGERPCARARRFANLGEYTRQRPNHTRPEARRHLEAAQLILQGECRKPDFRAFVLTRLAELALDEGDLSAARAALDASRDARARADPWLQDDRALFEARLAREAGAPDRARRGLEAHFLEAGRTRSPLIQWRVRVELAQSLRALGRVDAAIEHLERAEALLDSAQLHVGLGSGRQSFLTRRDLSARLLVELLTDAQQPGRALAAARRSRARGRRGLVAARIAGLSERERAEWYAAVGRYRAERRAIEEGLRPAWGLSRQALARQSADAAAAYERAAAALERAMSRIGAPSEAEPASTGGAATPARPGELLVVHHPLTTGWLVLELAGGEVRARRIGGGADLPTAAALAAPAQRPAGVRQVSFAPYGATRGLDLHVSRDAQPLPYPAVQTLDLRDRPPRGWTPGVLLAVSDPKGDLPEARREIAPLVRARRSARRPTTALTGAAATRAAVLSALRRRPTFVYFAGHGQHQGPDGWESAIELADGVITTADILALDVAPAIVVLSSCESGGAGDGGDALLGLAEAFLVRGAQVVLAPARPVPDDTGRALGRHLAALAPVDTGDPGRVIETFDEARRRMAGDTEQWRAFRILVP